MPIKLRFSLAPIAPFCLWVLLALSAVITGLKGVESNRVARAALLVFYSVPIHYGLMLLIGVPYVRRLERRGWLSWRTVTAGAAAIGALAHGGFWGLFWSYGDSTTFLLGASLGLITGLEFSHAAGLFSSSERIPPT